MENQSSDMLGPRLNFGFAFNDTDFCDRVLHIEILADSLDSESDSDGWDLVRGLEKSDLENETSNIPRVKTLHISSAILAANSPFFYKLFKYGLRESQEKGATLTINKSEEASLTDLLNFVHNNTLSATTIPDLLRVLIIAHKFEVTSCVRYCSALLQKRPMSLETALLYLELPSTVLVSELLHPLIHTAKMWLVAHFSDINRTQEEAMTLPLSAVEVVLGSDSLKVDPIDDVYEFILKWARAHYPDLEVRREILTKRLTKFIPFQYMSCSKLREVLICPGFDYEQVSKLVNEALFSKVELSDGQRVNSSEKGQVVKVQKVELQQPRSVFNFDAKKEECVVYFDIKKEECENLVPSGKLWSPSFGLGGRWFYLAAQYYTEEQKKSFGLYLYMTEVSESCTIYYEFAEKNKSSKKFQNRKKGKFNFSQSSKGWGFSNLFGITWMDFMSEDSDHFIDGILHLRAVLTIKKSSQD